VAARILYLRLVKIHPWDGQELLSARDAWNAQDDLSALCADRPLRSDEIFHPNSFYGFDQVVKRYADLAASYSLKAVIPHGTVIDPGFVWRAEQDAPVPAVICWEPQRRPVYKAAGGKIVLAGAAPYLYLTRLLATKAPQRRAGTLAFPSHSTHHVDDEADYEHLAHRLSILPDRLSPVTVCLYWRDLHLGRDAPFRRRGLQIVSAGHMYDPDFPARLHHLSSRFTYATGNEFGSHMFHAVASGCQYFHVGDAVASAPESLLARREPDGVPWVEPDYPRIRPIYDEMSAAFGTPTPTEPARQRRLTEFLFGASELQSRAQLRETLLRLERIDRWGSALLGLDKQDQFIAPSVLRRQKRRLRSLVRGSPQPSRVSAARGNVEYP